MAQEARTISRSKKDLLIVGAGPVGCVIAERAASQKGWESLIIDRRAHLAGNCYDRPHKSGVLIHEYGPHYFRTNSQELLDYLSVFTEWVPGNYVVKSSVLGKLFPFPINLTTLEMFFRKTLTAETAEELLRSERENFPAPANSEEFVLSRVGRRLFEAFYLGYTKKQWGRSPSELDASVCGRIPVRLNRDERYVDHKFQVTPKDGFTKMFERMIDSPKISLRLNTEFSSVRGTLKPRVATVYCGPIDEYFGFSLGRLTWRSLDFEFKEFDRDFVQPCVQINHPNEHAYTRTVEIKHVTAQKHPKTVVSYEYPKGDGDPYYPVPSAENIVLYQKYRAMADAEACVHFVGRLAEYKYMNTDEAIEAALKAFSVIANGR